MGNYFSSGITLEDQLCESCYRNYKRDSLGILIGKGWVPYWQQCIPLVAKRGHPICLQVLIKAGVIPQRADPKLVHQEALHQAATEGRISCVEILVEAGADVNPKGSRTCPPLIMAVKMDHYECVNYLLDKGADVNAVQQRDGSTALMEALQYGCTETISPLIAAGADVSISNARKETAVIIAAKRLISRSTFQLIMTSGADVNSTYMPGVTGIRHEIAAYSQKMLNTLIDAGADVNSIDEDGNTPLIVVSGKNAGGVTCAKLLLRRGAKVNLLNHRRENALLYHINTRTKKNQPPDKTMVLLLYAAGESLDGGFIDEADQLTSCVLDYLERRDIRLKQLCREAIRAHLLDNNYSKHNLFSIIPKLGLPRLLSQYLLFNTALNDTDNYSL